MNAYIKSFSEISIDDIPVVGGKNASLGEMYRQLRPKGIQVPDGFATTAQAYYDFMEANGLTRQIAATLATLDRTNYTNLHEVGQHCRTLLLQAPFTPALQAAVHHGLQLLVGQYGKDITLAVRSSATAEDLPTASFAGQLETYLNIQGEEQLLQACHLCFASLYTDRAIKYRIDQGFDSARIALSVGVQIMVRSDKACSGVMFTLDPDTGFEDAVLISGAYGLGENVVQGNVNTDEFLVYKPFLGRAKNPILSRRLGSKALTMVYADTGHIARPQEATLNLPTPPEQQVRYILTDAEVLELAQWATLIQQHYGRHMDIEWAKDGLNNRLYIVQARPETVHSQRATHHLYTQYKLTEKGKVLCKGAGLGQRILTGRVRLIHSPAEIDLLQEGEILVTQRTDPDWDPVLKKAGALITDQGGRTSHAAIVARELGTVAVIGTGNATQVLKTGQVVTVATTDEGVVYDGALAWTETQTDLSHIAQPRTQAMLILARPEEAFGYAALPNSGVGLLRMEFIINHSIGIHPMALCRYDSLKDEAVRSRIDSMTQGYASREEYFVQRLAEATATIAAAFYPREVIVRMSDFKTNEYAHLLGGAQFEPQEENPMIGFRGASRYYHPLYKEGFGLECQAMRMVREEMGFDNIKIMIPFCRTVAEARMVTELMAAHGLVRGQHGLEYYMMVEIPSNVLLLEDFATYFDGFSIGSNDLTQLVLGADRDSELLSDIFSPFDPAVMQLIRMAIEKARKAGRKIGLCGQAPSDYPEYARFLVECGIHSISFNPDALLTGITNIVQAETISTQAS